VKAIIIFSGYNMRALYAFMRTLEKQSITYFIIASSDDDEIYSTNYKDKVICERKSKSLIIEDLIYCIRSVQKKFEFNNYLIAPSSEALNRFLLEHRILFSELSCNVPLVDRKLYEKVSDKQDFGLLCNKYEIQTPKEYDLSQIKLPCVAKPKQYHSKKTGSILKPIIINKKSDLEKLCKDYDVDDFYFQEYIGGQSFYLLYYFFKNNTCIKFSQENLIQQKRGGSILAARPASLHLNMYSNLFENLFYSIGFTGLVMVEVKKFLDSFYMIEANPRFWGPSQLFVDANVNFFNAMLYEYEFLTQEPDYTENILYTTYYWDDGQSFSEDNIKDTMFYNLTKQEFLLEYSKWDKDNFLKKEDTMNVYYTLTQGEKYAG